MQWYAVVTIFHQLSPFISRLGYAMEHDTTTLFCTDCMATIHKDGWTVNRHGKDAGLCVDCVKRYRHGGDGPVRIGVSIPAVLAAIRAYCEQRQPMRARPNHKQKARK
jgi:hypothetical protein